MSRRVLDGWSFGLGLGILLLAGCTESTLTFGTHCRVATDCVGGTVCRDGACVTPGGVDGDVDSETEAQDLAEPDAEQSTQMDGDTDAPEAERDEVEMTDQEGEGERLEAPPNDTCAGALPLALDTPTFGTTRGANNDFVPGLSCTGSLEGGADVVYRLTLQKDEELSVYAVPQTAGFDLSIYLLPLCQDNPWPGCLAAADAAEAEARESFTFKADHSGEYFLVVDSRCGPNDAHCSCYGDFTVAVNRRPKTVDCGSCGAAPDYDCGELARCVTTIGPATEDVEKSCMRLCGTDTDCPKAYACKSRSVVRGAGSAMVCAPRYGEAPSNTLATCGGLLDVGTPCKRKGLSDDEAACGADLAGRVLDDAVCYAFVSLTGVVTYCTLYCVDDRQCPAGTSCYNVPLSADKVCKRL